MSTGCCIYFPDKRKIRIECEVIFNQDKSKDTLTWNGEMQHEGEKTKHILHPHSPLNNDTPDSDLAEGNQPEPQDTEVTELPHPDPPTDKDQHPCRPPPQPSYYRMLAGLTPHSTDVNITIDASENADNVSLVALLTSVTGSKPCTL